MIKLLLITIISISGFSQINLPIDIETIPISNTYLPFGFDDNDNAEFVIEGVFPSTCYSALPPVVSVNKAEKKIYVKLVAIKLNQPICLRVQVVYPKVLEVGQLPEGDYKIIDSANDNEIGAIHVGKAPTEQKDDFIYAPINQAFVTDMEKPERSLVIEGDFKNKCVKLKSTEIYRKPDNVLVVLPKVEVVSQENCVTESNPFKEVKTLPYLKSGRYLIHIRTINGTSYNQMVEIPPQFD